MILFDIEKNEPVSLLDVNRELNKNYIYYAAHPSGPVVWAQGEAVEWLPDRYIVLINPECE